MSVFINKDTKLVVQGITGRDGSFHTKQMMEYGTQVVAGVTPGKGGQKFEDRVPVFNTVADAVSATGANTAVIYVPPPFAADAIHEAGGKVFGDLYRAKSSTRGLILMFHQAGSNYTEYSGIAPRVAALGWDCLAVDQRSGGDDRSLANLGVVQDNGPDSDQAV